MYLREISAMMHTFGDVKEPKRKSVELMQTIVQDQMKLLLLKVEKIASIRKSPEITYKDVLFLMRRNKMKLKHLLEYLYVLDLKQTYNKDLNDENITYGDLKKVKGKRVKKCLNFLASIEDCYDITSVMKDETIIDVTTIKRKMRRYWMTLTMTAEEYDEFTRTSQASFYPLQKFRRWLLENKVLSFGLTDCAVRIIDFLARETIAEIVDMVLIMKMKKLGKYQPLYFDNFVSHMEITDISVQGNEKDNEGDYSASTPSNNVSSSYNQHSRRQMSPTKKDKCKKNSHASCKENYTSSEKSDLLSYNLPPRKRTEHEFIGEVLNCDSESRTKLESNVSEVQHDKVSNETESNSVPVDLKKTEFNHMQNQLGNLIDIADDDIMFIPKSEVLNKSSDVNRTIVHPGLSDFLNSVSDDFNDSYSPSNSLSNSENTFQGTPIARRQSHSGQQSQENNLQIQDISDTSDCENFPHEAVTSCDRKKSVKRKISPSKHFKKIAQEESIDNSTIVNYLSVATQNEVKYITQPIEPAEILEAFTYFQEPSPMVLIFAGDRIPRKTKLICLAESSSFSII